MNHEKKGATSPSPTPFNNNVLKREASTLDEAVKYAAVYGWHIFPVIGVIGKKCSCANETCNSPGKHPDAKLVRHGHKEATNRVDIIKDWFTRAPNNNIGLNCGASDLLVVDVDERHDGFDSLRDLEKEFGKLPKTATSKTGGGGLHLFFKADKKHFSSRIGVRPGIDIKSHGGYVVLPPSKHASGGQYAWDDHIEDIPVATLPQWLKEFNRTDPRVARPPDYWRDFAFNGATEGGRNNSVMRIAGYLLRRYVDAGLALEFLQLWNQAKNRPPLSPEEVERTINNAAKAEFERRKGIKNV